MNQQLTVRQQKLSSKIQEAGQLTDISFARNAVDFVKIKDLEKEELSVGFAIIFIKVANLAGIKEAITEINKNDISEMIQTMFKSLSLEEIDYAFKLERYGVYEYKTEHYQLFNAEYVSTVLNKYKKWVRNVRVNNNLPLSNKKIAIPEISEAKKLEIVMCGLEDSFHNFKETQTIKPGRIYLYDFLYEKGLMSKDVTHQTAVLKIARKNILKKQKNATTREEKASYKLTNEQGNHSDKVISEFKRLSIINLFNEFTTFDQLINKL